MTEKPTRLDIALRFHSIPQRLSLLKHWSPTTLPGPSKMDPFLIKLEDGKQISGFINIPATAIPTSSPCKPLVVFMHGGTYTAKFWDAHPDHSIMTLSNALNIPVVSINAPGTLDTTMPDMSGEGKRWYYESAELLNNHFLPAIYERYGKPNGANSIFLWGHSMGSHRACVTAGRYFESLSKSNYPLCGILLQGFGVLLHPYGDDSDFMKIYKLYGTDWPQNIKDKMFLRSQDNLSDPSKFTDVNSTVNIPLPWHEQAGSLDLINWGQTMASQVECPVMHVLADHDCFHPATEENMAATKTWFSKSRKVQTVKLLNAPHAAELSNVSTAYYLQGFGFALESAVVLVMGDVAAFDPTESVLE